jgi:hypothetical protein
MKDAITTILAAALLLTIALVLTACGTSKPTCQESLYGCHRSERMAAPATPKAAEKPTERPGPIKPDKPTKPDRPSKPHGDKPGHGHGDSNHGHSGPRGKGHNSKGKK